jgi:hypothetical protein
VVRIDKPHHQLTTVIRKFEDLHVDPPATATLNNPDVAFWIIRADINLVWLVQD